MSKKGYRRFLETGKIFRDGNLVSPQPKPAPPTPEEVARHNEEMLRAMRRLLGGYPRLR